MHPEILKKIPILKKLRTLEQEAGKYTALKTTPAKEDETKKSKELKCQPNCQPKSELQCEYLASEDAHVPDFSANFLKVLSLYDNQLAKDKTKSVPTDDTGAEHTLTTFQKLSINGHILHAECVGSKGPKTLRGYQTGR